jgi:pimeloyl-ACP methyl ester carboxylesterase
MPALIDLSLPVGIRSHHVQIATGPNMHILEAGEPDGRPLILLLHGFPELAYSWRKAMTPLADAGYYIVAPDQRGYGRTTGWDDRFNGDLQSFTISRIAIDAFALVRALGMKAVHTVVGHDFGSPIAAWCGLTRPDVFRSCVMMKAPYRPAAPVGSSRLGTPKFVGGLAELERPRKHYVWYYSTPEADDDMRNCPQGISDFLRAYFHVKSGDRSSSRPFPLQAMTADELAKLPTYYVMDRDADMAATVAPFMPSSKQVASCQWMTESDLDFYATEFGRTGFQGGLNWYRCGTVPGAAVEMELFDGRRLDVPSMFIGGERDWGIYQTAGAMNAMETACSDYRGTVLVPGAGHWVQQEAPDQLPQPPGAIRPCTANLDAKMRNGASAWRSSQMRERLATCLTFFGHQCGLEGRTPRAREHAVFYRIKLVNFSPENWSTVWTPCVEAALTSSRRRVPLRR